MFMWYNTEIGVIENQLTNQLKIGLHEPTIITRVGMISMKKYYNKISRKKITFKSSIVV